MQRAERQPQGCLFYNKIGNNMMTILQCNREELRAEIKAIYAEIISDAMKEAEAKAKEMLLTPTEVCEQLKISDVTLWRWQKAEYLTPLYIGGKRRFKSSEVQAIIEKGGAGC